VRGHLKTATAGLTQRGCSSPQSMPNPSIPCLAERDSAQQPFLRKVLPSSTETWLFANIMKAIRQHQTGRSGLNGQTVIGARRLPGMTLRARQNNISRNQILFCGEL